MSNRNNRVRIQDIDPFTEDIYCTIDPYLTERHCVADKLNIPIQPVSFRWYSGVGETVIFVNSKFQGYVSDIWDGVII